MHEGVPVKQIVQCRNTPHPFVKTATPRLQFLWHPEGWRSLTLNPKLDLCTFNTRRAIAQTVVALPEFLTRKVASRRVRTDAE